VTLPDACRDAIHQSWRKDESFHGEKSPLFLNRDVLATREGDDDGYDVPVLKGSDFGDSA
jgi:hypothetical protein